MEEAKFSPVFMTEKEYEEAYKQSVFYVDKNYMEEYHKHIVAMDHIANIAKCYILNNWKKVTDWSGLDVDVTHGPTGEVTEYYNYDKVLEWRRKREEEADAKLPKLHKSKTLSKLWEEMEERQKAKHNPITEFNDVVLDPTDGDFSVTINGKEHWWIGDSSVITIADYIEKQLNTKES